MLQQSAAIRTTHNFISRRQKLKLDNVNNLPKRKSDSTWSNVHINMKAPRI